MTALFGSQLGQIRQLIEIQKRRGDKMKRSIFYTWLVLALGLGTSATYGQTGNGAPNGPHYNLNVICVPKGKKADMTGTQGHTIFVPCQGTTKIDLIEGTDFEVIDRNGTDGLASFQLPPADSGVINDQPGVNDECTLYNSDGTVDPDGIPDLGDYYVCGSGTSVYSVFVRALGNPRGTAVMMLCGVADDGITEVCGTTNKLTLDASGRPAKFENVTANLLYLYNVTIDGAFYKRIPLFSDVLQDYFWSYDNKGLKLLQLRFYHCTTLVPVDWPGEIDDSACFAK
jgi:hypothetical protein